MRYHYLLFAAALTTPAKAVIAQDGSDKDDRIQEMLREAEARRTQDEERRRIAAEHHYKTALKLYNRTLEDGVEDKPRLRDLQQAKKELENALAFLPEYKQARELLTSVNSALGVPDDRYEAMTRRAADERNALYQQQIAEIENRYEKAVAKYNSKNFDGAIADFESILDAIDFLPYYFDFTTLRGQIEGHIKKAQLQQGEHARQLSEMRRNQAAELARQDLTSQRQIRSKRIEQLFERARIRYEGHEYAKAIKLLNEVIALDPNNREARLMRDDSEFNLERTSRVRIGDNKGRGWESTELFSDEQYTLYDPSIPMHYPHDYVEIAKRRKEDLFKRNERTEEDWKTRIKAKLQQKATDPYKAMPPSQIIEALQSIYEVTIIVDNEIDVDTPIDLPLHNMTFRQGLDILVDKLDPDGNVGWSLKNGAIYIGDKTKFQEDSELVHYDVRDLIGELKDFRGPEISLAGGEEGGGGISIEESSSETDEPITGDDLVDLIQSTISSNTWDEDAGRTINIRNGAIVVNHTPEVHEEIQNLLNFMRKQRALQVSIQTRFLRVIDNDINHIGIDWTGLDTARFNNAAPGNPAYDPAQSGGVVFSGIEGSLLEGPGAGTGRASAGYVGPSDGAAFMRGNLIQSTLGTGYRLLDGTPGDIIGSSGGTLAWEFLNDFQVSALIQAVSIRQKGTLLVAPMITSFNTQRANISVLQQAAYIRDLTAVVNVQIGLFDPDIGYIQSGTTLDVRPIVSHDRKYITLELRPTVAQLEELRAIPVVADGIAGAEFIEAPEMTLRAIRTTVSVPDGGTLLIGGYSTGQEIDDYAGLPMLSKIPVLNFLMGAQLRDRERLNDYMLVKATIVDQTEIERDLFGRID